MCVCLLVCLSTVSPSACLLILLSLCVFVFLPLSGFLDQFRMASCDSSESHGDRESAETEGEVAAQREGAVFVFVCLYLSELLQVNSQSHLDY